jgi:hypothetical protein
VKSIFFDLETSDRHPIGQILNYSFILVDDDFVPIERLNGLVRISRLQIPSPQAILANRINVLEHQQQAVDTEVQALTKIYQFIAKAIEKDYKLPIIGYNAARFDIPYLRTSFIRNGINPYFNGKIIVRDLLFLSRRLAVTEPEFPRSVSNKDTNRISYSLENLSQQFGLLTGSQLHESEADVLLTIELAEIYFKRFNYDIRRFEPFEAFNEQSKPEKGMIRYSLTPEYNVDTKDVAIITPLVLLDFDYRSSLWVDLSRFKQSREKSSINWYNHNGGHQFICAEHQPLNPTEQQLVSEALSTLSHIKLKNFFEPSSCDIEQDIYRLDFDAIAALEAAIWRGEGEALKKTPNRDARVLFMRYQLNADCDKLTEKLRERLLQYAEYRYLGKAQLAKSIAQDASDEKRRDAFHPTLDQILKQADEIKSQSKESEVIMQSLISFIRSTEIFDVLSR